MELPDKCDPELSSTSDLEIIEAEKVSVDELIVKDARVPYGWGDVKQQTSNNIVYKITNALGKWGLETNGIDPVPPAERTDPRLYQLFFVWFAANMNILTMTAGTVGPAFYGLGIRDSFLIILVVDVM